MKSVKLQLLVTFLAVAATVAIFALKGPPPTMMTREAVIRNDVVQVRRNLAWVADANAPDEYGVTPLYWAVYYSCRNIVACLLAGGLDPDARGGVSRTPLHCASVYGNEEEAMMLIAHGADIHARDWAGRTPLHLAARGGKKRMAELLIAGGADINARDDSGRTPLKAAQNSDVSGCA